MLGMVSTLSGENEGLSCTALLRVCSVTLAGEKVLSNVDFQIASGEVVGIHGENGSGKSTLLRVLAGLLIPDIGSVEVFGSAPTDALVRLRIGAAIDTPAFYGWMSGRGFLRTLVDMAGVRDDGRSQLALERFGLAGTGRKLTSRYSQGMKKRLALAAASLHAPDLLLLDEPTNALDPEGREVVRKWIERERDRGTAVVLVSHRDEDVAICDRVFEMDAGKLGSAQNGGDG
jgi:ABC-2 type transport system ATP-binding protein